MHLRTAEQLIAAHEDDVWEEARLELGEWWVTLDAIRALPTYSELHR